MHYHDDEGAPAEEEVRKCLNAAFAFPQDVYSFLQDTSYERAKDVQEFQEAVLSLIRRGGFGLDGQDAAELAIADKKAMKRVGTAMEHQHGGELAELDKIGMASGQPLGEEDKAQRVDPATKATEVESGQPQGEGDKSDEEGPRNGSDGGDGEGFSAEKT